MFERFERSATNVTRQDQKLWKLVESCFPTANTHTQTQTDMREGEVDRVTEKKIEKDRRGKKAF